MRTTLMLLAAVLAGAARAKAGEEKTMDARTEFAVIGGGCFWCMDAVFEHVPGVKSVTCGYAGGHAKNPTYEEVCTGETGHAEVVRLEFDPAVVSYAQLLKVFWDAHDPTTLDRQGADEGTQYRSIILYTDPAQKAEAEKSLAAAQSQLGDKIVTQIVPLQAFYPAEEHHQHFFAKNPSQGYCRVVIKPKVSKLQKAGVIAK